MRMFTKALFTILLIGLIAAPGALWSGGLQLPRDVSISSGVTTVNYGGQSFTFVSNVRLRAKFAMVAPGEISLRVRSAQASGSASGPGQPQLQLHWEDQDLSVY